MARLEARYPGQRGGQAIAALLTGKVSPCRRLPITFPKSLQQLPRPKLDGYNPAQPFALLAPAFKLDYNIEGSDVGYRWFERTHAVPLFPFGYGLTYTTFRYRGLKLTGGNQLTATFTITNAGRRAGVAIAQLYVAPPGRTHHLAGGLRLALEPGETRNVSIRADPRLLASWHDGDWLRASGAYDVWVSPSSVRRHGLHGTVRITEQRTSASGAMR